MNRIGCKDKSGFLRISYFILFILSILSKESGIFKLSNTGNFRQDREDEQDECKERFTKSCPPRICFHPVNPLHPVQRIWNLFSLK